MSTDGTNVIRIFTIPLQTPCGPQATCCGPIGQSEEEVQRLKEHIEHGLGVKVEVKDVLLGEDMREHREISALYRTFGAMCLPIITVGDEVVSMGNPAPEEAIELLREKLSRADVTKKGGR